MSDSGYQLHQQRTPTVVPAPNFDPAADAKILRDAIHGLGTNEQDIIKIITRRTYSQRVEIETVYNQKYGNLIDDIKGDISGNFENVIIGLMTSPIDYYAKQLNNAISGAGTDEGALVEILSTLTNTEIRNVIATYERLYKRTLENDIRGDTSGELLLLLLELCKASRDETGTINQSQIANDVQLFADSTGNVFREILCARSFNQLRLTFIEYNRLKKHEIEDKIRDVFSGDGENGLLALVNVIRSMPLYFTKRLRESVAGAGTSDGQLIRISITRSEIDLGDIKILYASIYGKSLETDISDDTSGDYRASLLSLVSLS